ncbi:MAG TPA: cell division protein FtsQ/DivIB [Acetobacteraceae bacterium]|nr:cell division protein FtsQ/DivIB [Acetobacteraceae bacterium]
MPRMTRPARRGRGRSTQVIDRPSPLKLLLRRLLRLRRPLLWTIAVVALLFGVPALLRAAHPGRAVGPLRAGLGALGAAAGLTVRHVVIEGRANTPRHLVLAALAVKTGTPILGFSVAAARARVEKLSWVRDAMVTRELPGTVLVRLTERRPYAVWQNNGRFVLIDRDGRVVAEKDVALTARQLQLPLVVGPGAATHAEALLATIARYPVLHAKLTAAVRVGDRRWNLELTSGANVKLPARGQAQAIARLMELQKKIALLDRPVRTVDLRLPGRLVVHPFPPDSSPQPSHGAAAPPRHT